MPASALVRASGAEAPAPACRFLANRPSGAGMGYATLISAHGTGFSRAGETLLTRWSAEWSAPTDGMRVFVRDRESGTFWAVGESDAASATAAVRERGSPPAASPLRRLFWKPGVATIEHDRDGLATRLDVCVLPDADAELRRITVENRSHRPRRIDATTCAEVVLHDPAAHAAHPVFSKLFLQTAYMADLETLLVRRRPRAGDESHPWLVHACLEGSAGEHETDRARFLGRGYDARRPAALVHAAPLSGTVGSVLDPVVALRCAARLAPGAAVAFSFLLGAAPSREEALRLVQSLRKGTAADAAFVARLFTDASRRADAQLAELDVTPEEHALHQELAGAILYAHPALRAAPEVLERAGGDPSDLLARLGLDARQPVVVVHAGKASLLKRVEAAARSWRALGLPIQVVDIGEIPADALTEAERDLLDAVARLVVRDRWPTAAMPALPPLGSGPDRKPAAAPSPADLVFFNGFGGFSASGDEYVIPLGRDEAGRLRLPPQPWINVLANDQVGCIVSESGAGMTWSNNSRENRLTPWSNDPVLDPPGEAFYLRKEPSGALVSCFPSPRPGPGTYEMRHAPDSSLCRYDDGELEISTRVHIAADAPVRMTTVRVTSRSATRHRLGVSAFARLVLGGDPVEDGRFVVAWRDEPSGALLARNRMAGPFAEHVAFGAVVASGRTAGDAGAKTGASTVHQATERSAPLARELDPSGPGYGACFAHATTLDLAQGATVEVTFLLGQALGVAEARALVERFGATEVCARERRRTRAFWSEARDDLRVETPSRALDLLVNGWLAHQTFSCRLRGRTALYQSGGAYGYRDQLQDALALLPWWPERARDQIVLHAAHQFVEGDVLHWWHPPASRGIRTRFADDRLWLPYLTAQYVAATGDASVLDEIVPYRTARTLAEGEDEAFLAPDLAGEEADIYDHCCRAIDVSLGTGAHGLPLFGTGDWNDGMNRVGREGRGESVWMGFFLVAVIDAFVPWCERRSDDARAARYRRHREELAVALNEHAWDGDWYLRGFYDDGSPLGSHRDQECRIDGLVQAWSVLSGVAPPERAQRALDAVEEHLISETDGLIRLLTPPFADTPRDPGYIKGYVPGVRENGGQYTHAALWVVRAMAEAGRRDRAAALLDLLNPIRHAETAAAVDRYRVEPYVVAADVYGVTPHVGRGGWTWYTGASGWMLRVALESVLGLRLCGREAFELAPCVPNDWPQYRFAWRVPGCRSRYDVVVRNPERCSEAVVRAFLDDEPLAVAKNAVRVPLVRDGGDHRVEVVLGRRGAKVGRADGAGTA